MKYHQIVIGLMMVAGLTGCASGWPHGHQTDYANLPGTRDTAEGPGLLSGNHYDSANGGGTLLYSSNKTSNAVFGSSAKPKNQRDGSNEPAAGSDHTSAGSSAAPSRSGNELGSDSAPNNSFSDFQQFQAYQRFQQLPADSPERQRFKTWQQWQKYQRWKQQQSSQ